LLSGYIKQSYIKPKILASKKFEHQSRLLLLTQGLESFLTKKLYRQKIPESDHLNQIL